MCSEISLKNFYLTLLLSLCLEQLLRDALKISFTYPQTDKALNVIAYIYWNWNWNWKLWLDKWIKHFSDINIFTEVFMSEKICYLGFALNHTIKMNVIKPINI